ncbi:nucleotidyltransferase domain-containing protein [Anaerostipes sp.]|uniref:nucleotidyltransferase domain-containing protein n=1 Tax=Anaerostipes sp. TaxID=1872530 RepID=UPI0025802C7A|nr:nucleotidyltransferase family protein [Anaerostipes sp.]
MKIETLFLSILKDALHGEVSKDIQGLSMEEWEKLFQIAKKQSVAPMIYQQIFPLPAFGQADPGFQNFWKMNTLQEAGNQARCSALFLMLYDKMRQNGFTPLVVKGIVCRNLYPNPDLRISGDEDLLIPREQFALMDEFLLKEGFVRENLDEGKEYQEVGYHHLGNGLYLEMHMDLFAKESGAYGHLNDLFTEAFDTSVIVNIQGSDVHTLNPQLHFLYLLCHSLKHFLHSGFGVRQVCDMLLFAQHYASDIHWTELIKLLRENQMYDFSMNLMNIGVEHFGFTWDDIAVPKPDDVEFDSLPLLNDMLDGGIYGKSDADRVHSANITLNAAENETASAASGILASLFPDKDYIQTHYPYTKKWKILLPVGYLHRICAYLLKRKSAPKNRSGKSSTQIGMERVRLLEKYKILDK